MVDPYGWEKIKMFRKDIFLSDVPRYIKDAVRDYDNKYGNVKKLVIKDIMAKPMDCIQYYVSENKEFDTLLKEKYNVTLINDFSGPDDKLKKYKYINEYKKEYYVLQRKINNIEDNSYKCDIWHFAKDFNKKSALLFISQFDERNNKELEKTRHLKYGQGSN